MSSYNREIPEHLRLKLKQIEEMIQEKLKQRDLEYERWEKYEKNIALDFFKVFEYSHPMFKDINPYKQEFALMIDELERKDQTKRPRTEIIFDMYKLFLNSEKNITRDPSWIKNKPKNVTKESFKNI